MKNALYFIGLFMTGLVLVHASPAEIATDMASNRRLWAERTRGENIALGKKFIFSKPPADALTSSESDPYDLTDGKLITYPADKLWFDRAAVGWYEDSIASGVNMLIDLEKEENIGPIVFRILAGGEQGILKIARQIEIYVSKDGKNFYRAAGLEKLMPGEKDQSDFIKYFYLPEHGKAYTYPFRIEVNAAARYVGFRFLAHTNCVYLDEVAIIKAENSKGRDFNRVYQEQSSPFYMEGLQIGPRLNKFVVTDNLPTPTSFPLIDMRKKENLAKPIRFIMEIPENITLVTPKLSPEPVEINGKKCNRFTTAFKSLHSLPKSEFFFFQANGPVAPGATATFYAECGDEPVIKTTVPIEVVSIPEITPAIRADVPINLTWMYVAEEKGWPDYFEDWKKYGFNGVTCLPQYAYTPEAKKALHEYMRQARRHGYRTVMTESPFHEMERGAAEVPEKREMFSVLTSGKPSRHLCPSYTGKYYQAELKRIEESVRAADPDYCYYDIECFYEGAMDALEGRCARCAAAIKKSGKSPENYLRDCGKRIMRDLKSAVTRGRDGKARPQIGSYNHQTMNGVHQHLFDGKELLPDFLDVVQPSIYNAGRCEETHRLMRGNFMDIGQQRKVWPWLTAGCYGEMDPERIEFQIYEVLLNGGCGFGYYMYADFDNPLDYYYHTKALATIAPFQDIIFDGKVFLGQGSNKELFYSGAIGQNKMLLLIGNYNNASENGSIRVPLDSISKVVDLRDPDNRIEFQGNEIRFHVPKGSIRLLLIEQ